MVMDPETPAKPAAPIASELGVRPGFLIRRLHQIHLALFAEECGQFSITPVQYSVMTVAASRSNLEQAKLGYEIGVDPATLGNVVARLETRGLLSRAPSPSDRRLKLVDLTDEGRQLLRDLDAAAQRAHDRTVEALAPDDRARFMEALVTLIEAGNAYGRAPLRLV